MVGEFSLFHWLIVFAIVLLVFGPKRLPELAKALGTGIRDFKKALNQDDTAQANTKPTEHVKQVSPAQTTSSPVAAAKETVDVGKSK